MALAADKDGFLIGEPTEIDTATMAQQLELWRGVAKDVASIRESLAGMASRTQVETSRQRNRTRDSSPTTSITAGPRRPVLVQTTGQAAATPSKAAAPALPRQASALQRATNVVVLRTEQPRRSITPRERDARGRFIPAAAARTATPARLSNLNPGNGSSPRSGEEDVEEGRKGGRGEGSSNVRDLARSIGDAIRQGGGNAVNGADQLDPTIGAAREAAGLVAPVTGAAKAAGGGLFKMWQDRQERRKRRLDAKETAQETVKLQIPWFRRLLKVRGAGDGDGGGLLGMGGLGGLGSLLPGVGGLGGLAGAAGAGGLMARLLPKMKMLPKVLGKAALPLGGIASAVESLNTSTDDYASRMGGKAGESWWKDLGYRTAGVFQDFGNFLSFGTADKLGNFMSGGGWNASTPTPAPGNSPNPIANVQDAGSNRALLDLIGKEGGAAGYDAVWSGSKVQPGKPLSQMTLGEVKAWQQQSIKAGSKSSAAGRYQFVSKTLAAQQQAAGLKDTDMFDAGNQDKLALGLLDANKSSGLTAWREGRATDAQFSDYVASQWALFKNSSGRGTYDGDGLNKAVVGSDQVLAAARGVPGAAPAPLARGPAAPVAANANDTSLAGKDDPSRRGTGGIPATKGVTPVSAGHRLPERVTAVPAAGPTASIPGNRTPSAAPKMSEFSIPEAPTVQTQIGSNAKGKDPVEVIIPRELTQNVADRGIAQVATGGMGGNTARGMGG